MRAWRLHRPGGPEAFVLAELPPPRPAAGEALIQVRAFGLNRSEWFTRNGDSPSVVLPRVLGIECVGTVVDDELRLQPGPVWASRSFARRIRRWTRTAPTARWSSWSGRARRPR